jgi:hypothetical protein
LPAVVSVCGRDIKKNASSISVFYDDKQLTLTGLKPISAVGQYTH